MHLIIFVIFGIPLAVMLFMIIIGAPVQLIMAGIAGNNAGAVFAGILWLIIVWGGLFAFFGGG